MKRMYNPLQTSNSDGSTVPGSGTVTVEEVASTLQPVRMDVSKEETRTNESVHAPSIVVLLNSDNVRVSVVGMLRSALNGLTARPSG